MEPRSLSALRAVSVEPTEEDVERKKPSKKTNKDTRSKTAAMPESIEIVSRVPVVAKVDVLIVGGGIAGCVAAVTAARNGADVMIVERFGYLGGNMGPGAFAGGVVHLALCEPDAMHEGLRGIPGEFLNRCAGFVDGQLGHDKIHDTQVVAYVWLKMMEENGVRLLLNTVAAEPLMDGTQLTGLVIENRSGRQAIRAKAVVDATGEADVAARAGAPTDEADAVFHPGLWFAIGGVDKEAYFRFADANPPSDELVKWGRELFTRFEVGMFVDVWHPLLTLLKQAWDKGEYRVVKRIGDLATVTLDHGLFIGAGAGVGTRSPRPDIVESMVGLWGGRGKGWPDATVHTELEVGSRKYIFETVQFLRKHVPGFECAWLMSVSPYFHNRRGRSAVCEYVVTDDDVAKGQRHPDVVFRAWPTGAGARNFDRTGFDYPYRQFLPKEVDGLLMAGRSSLSPPNGNRSRYKILLMGQVAGLAAALASRDGVSPKQIDVKELQRVLYRKYHVPMEADEGRLRELGLV